MRTQERPDISFACCSTFLAREFPLPTHIEFEILIGATHPNGSERFGAQVRFLLPFDRRRWFTADIVANPIYPFYFIDNSRGDGGEQIVWQA